MPCDLAVEAARNGRFRERMGATAAEGGVAGGRLTRSRSLAAKVNPSRLREGAAEEIGRDGCG